MLFNYFVYIVTNESKTTLYIGVTNNIQRRLSQHHFDSENNKKSFAGKYNCCHLVYYEGFESIDSAILREKELKKWLSKEGQIAGPVEGIQIDQVVSPLLTLWI